MTGNSDEEEKEEEVLELSACESTVAPKKPEALNEFMENQVTLLEDILDETVVSNLPQGLGEMNPEPTDNEESIMTGIMDEIFSTGAHT